MRVAARGRLNRHLNSRLNGYRNRVPERGRRRHQALRPPGRLHPRGVRRRRVFVEVCLPPIPMGGDTEEHRQCTDRCVGRQLAVPRWRSGGPDAAASRLCPSAHRVLDRQPLLRRWLPPSRSVRRTGHPTQPAGANGEPMGPPYAHLRRARRGALGTAGLRARALRERRGTRRLTNTKSEAAQYGQVGDLRRQPLLQPLRGDARLQIAGDRSRHAEPALSLRSKVSSARPAGAPDHHRWRAQCLLRARHSPGRYTQITTPKSDVSRI